MSPQRTIGVDWGTSRFRAYLILPSGEAEDSIETDRGIMAVQPGAFGTVLADAVRPWRRRHPAAPIIASGMVGSRQGWREVPYVACPAGLQEIAGALAPVDGGELGTVWLVPGVVHRGDDASPDVMRGEETQLLGMVEQVGAGTHLVVLPGTHSKWAVLRAGRVASFTTYLTGELFAALVDHTILGRLMENRSDDEATFRRGVDMTGLQGRPLLGSLFSARSLGLLGDLPLPSLHSYLSGLLIGAEIAAGRETIERVLPQSVAIVGGAALGSRYSRALSICGISARHLGAEVTAHGLAALARSRLFPS